MISEAEKVSKEPGPVHLNQETSLYFTMMPGLSAMNFFKFSWTVSTL